MADKTEHKGVSNKMVSNQTAVPFQSVFKVDIKKRPGAEAQRQFVPRSAHRKSRDGCVGCKRRRIKCDEAKPQCGKCTKLKVECIYSEPCSPMKSSPSTTPHSVTSNMYSMAMDLVETDLDSFLFAHPSRIQETTPTELSSARMLQHFQSVASLTLGCSMVQNVMHSFVASNAWEHPYLMHMVLAMSCSHQKHLDCGNGQRGSLTLAEATHWERGLQLHRQHLATLRPGQDNGNWDSVVATTFLQIMLTFGMDDELPPNAVSNDAFSQTIDPLAAAGGFRSLFYLYGPSVPHSRWTPILLSTDDADGTFSSTKPGIDGLPRAFVELCALDETSTIENNPYHHIVRVLTPCLRLKPSTENFSTLFACLGRLWPEFKALLLKRDPRGLLLLSYWFALVRQVDQWWLTDRARKECMALVSYLAALQDPAIDALLPFPAGFGSSDISHMWQLLGYVLDDEIPSES